MKTTLESMIVLLVERDPLEVYQELLNTDDDFREFIERNKDKNTADMIKQFSLDKRGYKGHA